MIMPNVELDSIFVNEDGTAGKICHSCSAALQRQDKLESSIKKNLSDALDCIISCEEVAWLRQMTDSSTGSIASR